MDFPNDIATNVYKIVSLENALLPTTYSLAGWNSRDSLGLLFKGVSEWCGAENPFGRYRCS